MPQQSTVNSQQSTVNKHGTIGPAMSRKHSLRWYSSFLSGGLYATRNEIAVLGSSAMQTCILCGLLCSFAQIFGRYQAIFVTQAVCVAAIMYKKQMPGQLLWHPIIFHPLLENRARTNNTCSTTTAHKSIRSRSNGPFDVILMAGLLSD